MGVLMRQAIKIFHRDAKFAVDKCAGRENAGEGLRATPTQTHDAFFRFGAVGAHGPLLFAVPHAGRTYPSDDLERARVGLDVLARLEDRFADLLIDDLLEQGYHAIVARQPRAIIDLNRDEREVDLRGISGAPWSFRGQSSAKLRGGLGLIPERLASAGDLWKTPLPYEALCRRIARIHRPYHDALSAALNATQARYGCALLIDVHSMPPLRETGTGRPTPQVVIGDRFGSSATARLTDLCADLITRRNIAVAINTPYSGNHILERHGRPERGIHAIQIEFDRALYLDESLMQPGVGLPDLQQLLSDLALALTCELEGSGLPLAAE